MTRNASFVLVGAIALSVVACGAAPNVGDTFSPGPNNVRGVVLLGPMCPVEQENSPCPDQPTQARLRVTLPDGRIFVTDTDARGRFEFSLDPGSYAIQAIGLDAGRSSKPTTFRVTSSEGVTNVTVTVDSGIR